MTALLGYADKGRRWARRAHEDGQAAIKVEIPLVKAALNKSGNPLSRTIDSWRWSWESKYSFWTSITDLGNYHKSVVDRKMWRDTFTRTFTDGIELSGDSAQDHAVLGSPAGDEKADFALLLSSIAQKTPEGVRLMALHRLGRDTEYYRQVRVHICGDESSPAERLLVDMSASYQARLEWVTIGHSPS